MKNDKSKGKTIQRKCTPYNYMKNFKIERETLKIKETP